MTDKNNTHSSLPKDVVITITYRYSNLNACGILLDTVWLDPCPKRHTIYKSIDTNETAEEQGRRCWQGFMGSVQYVFVSIRILITTEGPIQCPLWSRCSSLVSAQQRQHRPKALLHQHLCHWADTSSSIGPTAPGKGCTVLLLYQPSLAGSRAFLGLQAGGRAYLGRGRWASLGKGPHPRSCPKTSLSRFGPRRLHRATPAKQQVQS